MVEGTEGRDKHFLCLFEGGNLPLMANNLSLIFVHCLEPRTGSEPRLASLLQPF